MTSLHDMSGRMFQRLIADRKFLATFYTLPTSAALLADLAVDRVPCDWSSPRAIRRLRVADLACGTGILLSAAYQAILGRHRRRGKNDVKLHRSMMETVADRGGHHAGGDASGGFDALERPSRADVPPDAHLHHARTASRRRVAPWRWARWT